VDDIEKERQRVIARFDSEMEEIYFRAKREIKYNATYFLQMLKEHGGLATAHRLLASHSIGYGFAELLLAGRPDLTMETLVLRPEFSALFSPEELAVAAERLQTQSTGAADKPTPGHPAQAPDMREILQARVGETIYTMAHGKPNRLLRIEDHNVIVGTYKSPLGEPVPIEWVQAAADRLYHDGELEISVASVRYRSAFIGAILSTLPGVRPSTDPRWLRLG